MRPETLDFLAGRYEASKRTQTAAGVEFRLTLDEYIGLWKRKPYYLREMAKFVARGSAYTFLRSDSGFVLGWRSKQDRAGRVMTVENAEILRREASKRRHQMQAGETHRPESREAISRAKRGKPQTDEHRSAISAALTGVPKSEESNRNRAAAARAMWARRRAEKEART